MNYIKLLIGVLLALSAGTAVSSYLPVVGVGSVIRVTDGDTLWVRALDGDAEPFKLRLRNIDAPEICQDGGPQAKAALESRVAHRTIRFETRARDTYHRLVADVFVDGEDVSAWLVRRGHAWSYGFRSRRGRYALEQELARTARQGLFAHENAIEPRRFRVLHGPCARYSGPDAQ